MLATQAAVSAALVATLQPPTDGVSFARFLDALVGGGVALLINALVLPARPLDLMQRAATPLLEELAAALEDVAVAVERRDQALAVAALERARGIDELAAHFAEAVDVSRETTRYAPPRRRSRGAVESYADAAGRIDLAVRNVRVLARGTIRALSLDENVPPEIAGALRDLAAAVRGAGGRARRPRAHRRGPRARPARGGGGHAGARGHRQPVRERDRGADPLDRRRPARRHRDELRAVGRGGARGRPRGRGRALTALGSARSPVRVADGEPDRGDDEPPAVTWISERDSETCWKRLRMNAIASSSARDDRIGDRERDVDVGDQERQRVRAAADERGDRR